MLPVMEPCCARRRGVLAIVSRFDERRSIGRQHSQQRRCYSVRANSGCGGGPCCWAVRGRVGGGRGPRAGVAPTRACGRVWRCHKRRASRVMRGQAGTHRFVTYRGARMMALPAYATVVAAGICASYGVASWRIRTGALSTSSCSEIAAAWWYLPVWRRKYSARCWRTARQSCERRGASGYA